MRTRIPLPFGRGLDRASGTLVVDPRAGADVRNVILKEGKAEVRPGVGTPLQTFAEGAVCFLGLFRAKAKLVAVTYAASTRAVKVYTLDLSGNTPTLIGTWGTLPDGAVEPPRFSMAEAFSTVLLAHDEPSVTRRLVTKTFDGTTLASLTANLDNTMAKDVLFRGVVEHLGYVWGWGFGADNDKSRPEAVRVSKPGDPTVFEPQSYFLAGARDDAVLACRPGGAGLLVLKAAETHVIVGADKRTFGLLPADRTSGVAAMRLVTSVGGTVYAWTLKGPARTTDGYWSPLDIPLELQDRLPAGLPEAGQLPHGHVTHLPDEQLLIWWFPDFQAAETIGFCLSERNGDLRWSYLTLPFPLLSGAVVAQTPETSNVQPGYASAVSHSGVQTGDTFQTKVTFTLNAYVGDETVEVWGRQGASAYTLLTTTGVNTSASSQSILVPVPAAGSWDLAVRFTRGGQARSDHADADPTNWPAAAKATGTVTALPALAINSPTYTPAATIAAGTWGASWGTPVSGAAVKLYYQQRESIEPTSYSGDGALVHTSAPNATNVSGLAASTLAGWWMRARVVQTLTVNGIAGSSPTSAWSSEVFFGLDEAPGQAGTPFTDGSYRVTEPPGTGITVHWVNSGSVASASAGSSDIFWRITGRYGTMPVDDLAAVAIPTTSFTRTEPFGQSGTGVSCYRSGSGYTVEHQAWVRHLLTIGGVQRYTRYGKVFTAAASGVCQL